MLAVLLFSSLLSSITTSMINLRKLSEEKTKQAGYVRRYITDKQVTLGTAAGFGTSRHGCKLAEDAVHHCWAAPGVAGTVQEDYRIHGGLRVCGTPFGYKEVGGDDWGSTGCGGPRGSKGSKGPNRRAGALLVALEAAGECQHAARVASLCFRCCVASFLLCLASLCHPGRARGRPSCDLVFVRRTGASFARSSFKGQGCGEFQTRPGLGHQ